MKVQYWIQTDKMGSKCSDIVEVDDDEWVDMTESEREQMMKEFAFSRMEWGYEEQKQRSEPRAQSATDIQLHGCRVHGRRDCKTC